MMKDYPPMTPKRIGAIFSAYSGLLCGDYSALKQYAEEKLGHQVNDADIATLTFKKNLQHLAQDDFYQLHIWCGGE